MSLGLVISSCDKYSFLWGDCVKLIDMHVDYNFNEKIIVSESKKMKMNDYNVTPGNHKGVNLWSKNLAEVLEDMGSKFILWTQDDYFFKTKLHSDTIDFALNHLKQNNLIKVGLYRKGPYYTCHKIGEYGKYDIRGKSNSSLYYTSLQLSLWDKDAMLRLLKLDAIKTPWDFELKTKGSALASEIYPDSVHYIDFINFHYYEAMRRGSKTKEYISYINNKNK